MGDRGWIVGGGDLTHPALFGGHPSEEGIYTQPGGEGI